MAEAVAALEAHRKRLATTAAGDGAAGGRLDAAEAVAAQLSYDLRLLRLCRVLGIPCDVRRFAQPAAERRRLEEAVQAALDGTVDGTVDGTAHGTAHGTARQVPDADGEGGGEGGGAPA
ncbi:MAG TPA: hypothetical protein VHB02_12650 [Acidimicrobiales bacterium]|nr:hypothetical protein [Acidimicrobiales bacterium]